MDCPFCGHDNLHDGDYCEECGADLFPEDDDDFSQKNNVMMRTCEYCGMMNPVDVQFCNNCQHDVYERPPQRRNGYKRTYHKKYEYNSNNYKVKKKNNFD